ncbi:FAD-binding oxidoreductase [Parapedomonas caeni]
MTTGNMQFLKEKLVAALGADAVADDAAQLSYLSNDVYRSGGLPALVVRPATVEALQAAVRLCAAAGVAMVPRGGGASYTDGYIHTPGGHVLIDTGALDSIEVDVGNAVVTVGAGATWAALKARLDPLGLRTPFWGPFSGIAATIGGSISQNTVSHGTAAYGISAESVLSIEAVLATGELIRTGITSATRFYGPDLTGLFTGDCGTLGIKTRITLPLIAARSEAEALSFAFDDFASCHAAVRLAQKEKLEDSLFGLDLALSQGQIARQEGVGARLKIAAQVMRKAPGKIAGLKQLMRMALAGEGAMRAGAYMAHFILEGVDKADTWARAQRLRAIIAPHGREIANTVPAFVRSMPFAPLGNILGPKGERWVPIHGVFNQNDVVAFHEAFQALLAARKADMDKHGVWTGTMFSPTGPSGFLYEIAIYWPDARTDYHRRTLGEEYLAGLPDYPANPEARAAADSLKRDAVALMQKHGAAHFQLGRAYPYQPRLDPQAAALLKAVKAALDPQCLMNPGALGL